MPRGQKTCDSCGSGNGPRANVCKKCGESFVFKAKSKEHKNTKVIRSFNWRELSKGDRIRVTGGPYYVSNNEFVPMGYRGSFIVDTLDDKGIRAFGCDKYSGFCHIYMGPDSQDGETKIWKTKHKVVKLKKKNS